MPGKFKIELLSINGLTVYNIVDQTGFTVRTCVTLKEAKAVLAELNGTPTPLGVRAWRSSAKRTLDSA